MESDPCIKIYKINNMTIQKEEEEQDARPALLLYEKEN
jgi:hypothetical protein